MKRAKSKQKAKIIPIRPAAVSVADIDHKRVTDDQVYREELCFRFRTDHFFAAKVIGFNDFVPRIHQSAVDLYPPKNPNVSIAEQSSFKFLLHIDPRKTFKTTLGKVDDAQWICAFPELITILHEGATQPLAEAISISVGKFFYQRPGAPPTLIQRMFPHLVMSKAPEGKWDTPNHSDLEMDRTSDFTSPKTSQSGWHPWVMCVDDMVDTTNSGIGVNHDTRQHVIDVYYTNKKLLRKGGYINLRGTRYHPFELYGDVLSKMNPAEWKVLIRGAMRIKSGARLMPGDFPAEDEVELLFPELLSYEELRTDFYDSYEAFMCQMMNDPQGGNVATFTEKAYSAALCSPERIPPMGETVICWRLPYGGKDYMSQYAEGAAARFYGNRVYIVDAWQGIYTPSGLAEKIVREQKRHQTGTLMMEAVPGTEYLDVHIRNEAVRRNVSLRIQWLDFDEDDNLRNSRIRQLEPALESGRISISTGATKAAEIRKQFLHFLLVPENGIIDCIARLTARLPIAVLRKELAEEEAELQRRRHEDATFNMIFGQGGMVSLAETQRREAAARAATVAALNRTNELGLPDLFGLDG
jgi:hypothetical protein